MNEHTFTTLKVRFLSSSFSPFLSSGKFTVVALGHSQSSTYSQNPSPSEAPHRHSPPLLSKRQPALHAMQVQFMGSLGHRCSHEVVSVGFLEQLAGGTMPKTSSQFGVLHKTRLIHQLRQISDTEWLLNRLEVTPSLSPASSHSKDDAAWMAIYSCTLAGMHTSSTRFDRFNSIP